MSSRSKIRAVAVAGCVLAMIGCGGGGGGASSSDVGAVGTETPWVVPTTPVPPNQFTAAQLHSCPKQSMSPIDQGQLKCLIGRFDQVLGDQGCSLVIEPSGMVTVSSKTGRIYNGKNTNTHQHMPVNGAIALVQDNSLNTLDKPPYSPYSAYYGMSTPLYEPALETFKYTISNGQISPLTGKYVTDDLEIVYVGINTGAKDSRNYIKVTSVQDSTGMPRIDCGFLIDLGR
jgi:hypothetical protein